MSSETVGIGTTLRRFRKINKLSQKELARRLYVSPTLISQIETGIVYSPEIELLQSICDVFGTTLGDFIRVYLARDEV
ncbi:MAG: hypothetical protein K940chlam2_01693 [Chlamydiae bacterium]|nr:hypothetical protein [Chlamydiota bacterium]